MKNRLQEWLKRYLPAEILSVAATLLAALAAFQLTGNQVSTALAATWVGNIAYFGYILTGDIFKTYKVCHSENRSYSFAHFLRNLRALLVEFGLAEVFDSFLIRPALMYYLPVLTGNLATGILLAKFAADITFYIPAIIGYEVNKRVLAARSEA